MLMFGDAIRILVSLIVAVEVPLNWASSFRFAITHSYNYAVIDINLISCGLDVRPLHENRVSINKTQSTFLFTALTSLQKAFIL